jgi:hypothetical protein
MVSLSQTYCSFSRKTAWLDLEAVGTSASATTYHKCRAAGGRPLLIELCTSSLGRTDTMDEVLEPGIGPQWVHEGVHLDENQEEVALRRGCLQTGKGFVLISEEPRMCRQ